MKHYVIPYVAAGGGWWCSADLYNSSTTESAPITIKCQDYNANIVNDSLTQHIKPLQHYLIPLDFVKNMRATLLISCGDDVMITPFEGYKDTGFGKLKLYKDPYVDSQVSKWKPYWDDIVPKREIFLRAEHIPAQDILTTDDPVIIKDVYENIPQWIVTNPLRCNTNIVEIYRHTRVKKINRFSYASDMSVTGKYDYWMYPYELRAFGKGDCDDWAIELMTYYLVCEVPNWRIRLINGRCAIGGHASVYVLKDDLKTWVHTNSTGGVMGHVKTLDHPSFSVWGTSTPQQTDLTSAIWSFNKEYSWKGFI